MQSSLRWIFYLGVTLFVAGLLIIMTSGGPELSAVIFMLMVLAGILYLMFKFADSIEKGLVALRRLSQSSAQPLRKYPIWTAKILGWLGSFFALGSVILFWDARSNEDVIAWAAASLGLSLVAVWAALLLQSYHPSIPEVTLAYVLPETSPSGFTSSLHFFLRRVRVPAAFFVGLLLMVILTLINMGVMKSDLISQTSLHVQFVLLVGAVVLLWIGLSGDRLQAAQATVSWRVRWRALWPLALITLLALVVRVWHLDTAMRFLVDERSFISAAIYEERLPFYGLLQPFSRIAAFPQIYPYWQSLMIELLGRNMVGFRAASAVVGTLAVPALYMLAQNLFDRKTALLAALLLATFPPHIHFSRIGLNNIADPLVGTAVFAFLSRALMTRRRSDFVLSGILLGFTQYFYEGGRLLLLPAAIVWLVGVTVFARIADQPPYLPRWRVFLSRFQRLRPNVVVMLIAAFIIGIPIYLTLMGIQRPILPRLVDSGLGLGAEYWHNLLFSPTGLSDHITQHIIPAFGLYFYWIDYTLFYSKTTSLLLSGMQIAVIVGLGIACYYWRKPGPLLILILVILTSLANSMMKNSISSTRFLVVFPALVLLAAVGIRYGVPLLIWWARWQTGAMMVLGVALALYQTNFYFNQHLPEYNSAFRLAQAGPDGYDAAWRSLEFPPNTQVHVFSTPEFNAIEVNGVLRVWRDDIEADTMLSRNVLPNYLKKLDCGVDHAFYVQKQDEAMLKILDRFFKLSPPQYTTYDDLDVSERYVLYYAAYDPNDGSIYSRLCSGQPAYDEQ
ncbi:MAG: glycosyltransferase family 39 protein [Chloroflexi bacterium]|nr:glycosyltransferase family 39 protein [Chloroflexota bacterium]MCC6895405.1 glycosyltransferase family 39 protein [Anaerolineae bacterium]